MGREERTLFPLHALCESESRLTSDDSRGLSQVASLIPFPKPSPYFTKKSFQFHLKNLRSFVTQGPPGSMDKLGLWCAFTSDVRGTVGKSLPRGPRHHPI